MKLFYIFIFRVKYDYILSTNRKRTTFLFLLMTVHSLRVVGSDARPPTRHIDAWQTSRIHSILDA